ncbi:MATE family efflux transporter [Methanobrevibacter filiformis]|uniref:Multidrug-efflux transporter n=1 Tax=Methanobrevibacter filiformis TaxID=55758 RepID=A0A162FEZ9_9EURY|nr:MATE family efflux transporter [Methanobrevibacter filiformis]KZX12105.1 multidrug export protein MepA [Methanobrevibacter filiformis]
MAADNKNGEDRVELMKKDPKKALRNFAWPMMLTMIIFIGNSLVNIIWVSGIGISAVAAVGFVAPLYTIIVGMGQGLGAGTISLIARSIGEENKKKVDNVALHSLLITLIASIIISSLFLFFLKDILLLIGAGTVLKLSMDYGSIIFLGALPLLLSVTISNLLRAEGDMKRATYAMISISLLNMILDPIFIYALNMGVTGAALSTVLASFISLIVMVYWILMKQDSYISFKLKNFHFSMDIIKDTLNVALPTSLEEFMMSLSAVGTNAILAMVAGSSAVAVYTIGWQVITLGVIPAVSIESATLAISGVAIGAKNYINLEMISNYGIKLGVVLGAVLTVIIFIFAPNIAQLFAYSTSNGLIASQIEYFIRILSPFFIVLPFGIISTAIFQGAGKGVTSLILNSTRDILLTLTFSYILGVLLGFGEIGVYWGILTGVTLGSIINYIYYRIFLRNLKNSDNKETKTKNLLN